MCVCVLCKDMRMDNEEGGQGDVGGGDSHEIVVVVVKVVVSSGVDGG